MENNGNNEGGKQSRAIIFFVTAWILVAIGAYLALELELHANETAIKVYLPQASPQSLPHTYSTVSKPQVRTP
ncbi:hypothetical protein HT585_28930 [Ensifer sp. HO-A22]|uniref:Uncharacterized protein n=1 Tax=Ensifer oleiphilus TaxID=2742698 RepID=A0A7Y6QC49_9HYPH|nr:hypothetical protein [Ensifer oleiphilus]NVD42896.1 hypothetical protein [Ensifer oleiphilus]